MVKRKVKIERKEYCQVHLDEWQSKLGVDDWFEYLDKPDRLLRVLERAKPFSLSCVEQIDSDPEYICWQEVKDLVTNWYGLWPDAAQQELEVAEAVNKLHYDWWKAGGFHDHAPEVQSELQAQYDQLVADYVHHLEGKSQ